MPIPDFNSLRSKCYIESFYINIILKQNKTTILLQFLVKKSNTVSFTFSMMNNSAVAFSRFRVTLIFLLLLDQHKCILFT